MDSSHSVSRHFDGLKQGDAVASKKIFERYLEELTGLAYRRLRTSNRKMADEEDVVMQAFAQFFVQVQQGKFPKLDNRHDLWQILSVLVNRRAIDQIRKTNTEKAGGKIVHTESIFNPKNDASHNGGIHFLIDGEPTPESVAELNELFTKRMDILDEDHRPIAKLRLEGYTNDEIAVKLSVGLRTVERRLKHIRSLWRANLYDE